MKQFKTYQLALSLYKKIDSLEIKNRYIRDQINRSSLSIVLNLAEGYGRLTEKDRKRFYTISFGSLRETQCLLELLNEHKLLTESDPVAACLFRLLQRPGSLSL